MQRSSAILASGVTVLALVGVFALLPRRAGDVPRTPPRRCVASHKEQQIYYPNLGLIGLGPAYAALALIPAYETVDVCDKWVRP